MHFKDISKPLKILSAAAFVLYIALLLRLTVFRDSLFEGTDRQFSVTMKLWDSYGEFLSTGQVIQFRYLLLGNFFCLAPLGFACGFFRKGCSLLFAVPVCLGATLLIEHCQLFLSVGYFELDDIIINALGGVFGYAVHLLACRIPKKQKSTAG